MPHFRHVAPFAAAVFVLGISTPLAAEIITDRPDAAESSRTVGAGRLQLETGVDQTFADSYSGTRFPTKLRLGLVDDLELHLESDIYGLDSVDTPVGAVETSGFTSVDIGGKYHFTEGGSGVPSLGVLLAFTIPTGGDLSDDTWGLTGLLAADFELADFLGLGTNLGLSFPVSGDGLVTGLYAVALGIGVPPVPSLGFFVEVFGGVNSEAFSMLADGGVTYLMTPTVQLDAYLRTGLINDDTDVGFGGGISVKL